MLQLLLFYQPNVFIPLRLLVARVNYVYDDKRFTTLLFFLSSSEVPSWSIPNNILRSKQEEKTHYSIIIQFHVSEVIVQRSACNKQTDINQNNLLTKFSVAKKLSNARQFFWALLDKVKGSLLTIFSRILHSLFD